jgi:hypothetical protein
LIFGSVVKRLEPLHGRKLNDNNPWKRFSFHYFHLSASCKIFAAIPGALLRTVIAVAGGAFAGACFGEPVWIFAAASAGMLAFALASIGGLWCAGYVRGSGCRFPVLRKKFPDTRLEIPCFRCGC